MADKITNMALNLKLQRESTWARKISITKQCERVHVMAVGDQVDPLWNKVQPNLKNILKEEADNHWKNIVEPLLNQGETAKLLEACNSDLSWKSIMFSVPKGVLKFAINASIDTLPSFTNLKQWGKRLFDNCPLCKRKGSLLHILNNCQIMLERYLWRHNNIIRILLSTFKDSDIFKQGELKLFADIENATVGGGTIPPNIIVTPQKPDIVIYWPKDKRVILFELTVPFETNIGKAHETKINRYSSLVTDITDNGYECNLIAVEIGSRGLIDTDNKNRLTRLLKQLKTGTKFPHFKGQVSKSALLSSYAIFNSRHEPTWNVQELI